MRRLLWICVLAVLALGPLARLGISQGNLGGVRGIVVDPSNLAIPGAEVEVVNTETNATFNTVTNASGLYQVGALPVGTYRLTVKAPGFKTSVRQSIGVATATVTTVDVSMEVGEVQQTVEVTGSLVALDTGGAEVSTVMEQKVLLDLPLSLGGAATTGASGRRQPENFIFLTPGVTGNQWNKSINGSPRFTTEQLYEGASMAGLQAPGFAARISPPYEAVEEFKVQNTLYPVEYGRGMGVLNFTLKSGTNDLHGSVYEYIRNDKLDASGFFSAQRPVVRQNEYGFTLGGPVVLPGYNGRDRTFFFGSFGGFELRGGAAQRGLLTIPTRAMVGGDFSEWQSPIFDPLTTAEDGQGGFVRDQFPNNQIPQSRFSPVTSKLLPDMPIPDRPGIFQNYETRQREPVSEKLGSIKVDHYVSSAHRLAFSFWRASHSKDRIRSIDGPLDPGWAEDSVGGGFRANWNYVASPAVLNYLSFGYTPDVPAERRPLVADRLGNTLLQIPNISDQVPGIPTFNFSGGDSPTIGDSSFMPTEIGTHNFNIVDSITWVKGRHQLKFGAEYLIKKAEWFQGSNQFGTFNFDRRSTSQPNSSNFNNWGHSFASAMLGEVLSANRLVNPLNNMWSESTLTFYAQDQIQVTPKLTMTFGLRWDKPFYLDEELDRVSTFDPTVPNPEAGGLPGALVLFGEGQGRNGNTGSILGDNYSRALSPRIAFAYRVTDKTVIRTGYGMFHVFPNPGRVVSGQFFQQGFTARPLVSSTDGGITSAFNLADGFPIREQDIVIPNTDPSQVNGGQIDFMNQDSNLTAINQSWTFSIQHELGTGTLLDLAYVGSKSDRTWSGMEDINQVHPSFLSLRSTLQANINSQQAMDAGITAPFPGFQGSVAQALRPFPQYVVLNDFFQPTGNSRYHAFQARFQKRYTGGLGFLVSYTLSKNLGIGSEDSFGDSLAGAASGIRALNTFARHLEKNHLSFDQTHVLVTSAVWTLPFGHGQKFGSNWSPALNAILGGWQLNAILRYQSGIPVAVGGGPFIPLFGGGNRPNWISSDVRTPVSMSSFDPATDRYINSDAFSQPSAFTFGTAPRRIPNLRGPFFFNEDVSVIKDFGITERVRVQFRAEFFNLFNRVVFRDPRGGTASLNNLGNFGRLNVQDNTPRQMQFGLRVSF